MKYLLRVSRIREAAAQSKRYKTFPFLLPIRSPYESAIGCQRTNVRRGNFGRGEKVVDDRLTRVISAMEE